MLFLTPMCKRASNFAPSELGRLFGLSLDKH